MHDRRRFLQSLACSACSLLLPSGPVAAEDSLPRARGAGRVRPGGGAPLPRADSPHVREAFFYRRLEGERIECETCPHGCILEPGELGLCRAKANLGGRHHSLSFGNPCSVHVDPVEKKPLLHYLPGSTAFSLAVAGCNFRCLNCQNWEISQVAPMETANYDLPPAAAVENARKYGCRSIAFTYSEPTSFYEYGVETSAAAKAQGVRSIWVSNGYIRREPLDRLCRSLAAAAINLKSFEDRIYRDLNGGHLQPVMDTLVRMKENGVWLEVIALIVPTWTDDLEMIRRMCGWHARALGPDTPLHFSRFVPLYKLTHLPTTPEETLVKAREIARSEGLHHVYIGNVPGLAENTLCPGCHETVIERRGFRILRNELRDGKCGRCGGALAGIWG
jgi:pyruvate formate lyase activating enzyme